MKPTPEPRKGETVTVEVEKDRLRKGDFVVVPMGEIPGTLNEADGDPWDAIPIDVDLSKKLPDSVRGRIIGKLVDPKGNHKLVVKSSPGPLTARQKQDLQSYQAARQVWAGNMTMQVPGVKDVTTKIGALETLYTLVTAALTKQAAEKEARRRGGGFRPPPPPKPWSPVTQRGLIAGLPSAFFGARSGYEEGGLSGMFRGAIGAGAGAAIAGEIGHKLLTKLRPAESATLGLIGHIIGGAIGKEVGYNLAMPSVRYGKDPASLSARGPGFKFKHAAEVRKLIAEATTPGIQRVFQNKPEADMRRRAGGQWMAPGEVNTVGETKG